MRKRKAHSRKRNACCNGGRKRSIRRAMRDRKVGSCISSRCGLSQKRSNPTIHSMSRCARSIGGIRKMNTANQKWKPCSPRSTVGTTNPQPDADGVVFGGVDREGNPHHGPQVDGFAETESRRLHRVWRLDLLRRSWLGQGQQGEHRGIRKIILATAGASSGRAIAALYIIAPARKPNGEPWSEGKKLVWWDQGQHKWTGVDVPDFVPGKVARVSPEWERKRTRCDPR